MLMDLVDLNEDPIPDVLLYADEKDIMNIYFAIVGPEGTPYDGGFLFFHIKFTKRYPHDPPQVRFLNPNDRIRFHPNLYENGNICLSILGTWKGPEWTSVMNIRSLILSIQSILSEHPLQHEPGFEEEDPESSRNEQYNTILRYSVLANMISDTLLTPSVLCLKPRVTEYVHNRMEKYKGFINECKGRPSAQLKSIYGMKVDSNYAVLAQRLTQAIDRLGDGS